jgi:purine-cytosine permease-like protein
MIPSIFGMILGAAAATTFSGSSNVISGLPSALPGWFVVPYLILAIISIYATNTLALYSSGLNLQAIGVRIRRWRAVCVDLTICSVLLFFVIFSSKLNTFLDDFLLFSLVWLCPWIAISVVDWLLRKGRYDSAALFRRGGGLYWRKGGVHVPAVAAQLAGMAGSLLWLNAYPVYQGPLSAWLSNSDLDIFLGGGLAAIVYYLWARSSVPEEAPEPLSDERRMLVTQERTEPTPPPAE